MPRLKSSSNKTAPRAPHDRDAATSIIKIPTAGAVLPPLNFKNVCSRLKIFRRSDNNDDNNSMADFAPILSTAFHVINSLPSRITFQFVRKKIPQGRRLEVPVSAAESALINTLIY